MTRPITQSLIALFIALLSIVTAAHADDIDIYTNPVANPTHSPNTIIVLDLNLIGVCDNVITDPGSTASPTFNGTDPISLSACASIRSTLTVTTYLTSIGQNATTFLSALPPATLCTMVSELGLTSPTLSLGVPLLGVTNLTCSTLATLSSILPIGTLTSFTASLVSTLLVPLTPTLLNALPTAFLTTLDATLLAPAKVLVDPTSIANLSSALGSILNGLINSNVAIMVSHSNRPNNGAQVASSSAACVFSATRNVTTPCANGAYFLVGLTALSSSTTVISLLTRVTDLLFNALGFNTSCVSSLTGLAANPLACVPNPSTLTASLGSLAGLSVSASSLTPPYQGKEIYDEIIHFITGDVIYNAPLGNSSSSPADLYDGVFSLLNRDTTIESSGVYKKPTLACPTVNVLNIQATNATGDNDSDTDLARFFPTLTLQPASPATGFTNVVQSAASPGFSDSSGTKYTLNSAFIVQQTLTSLTALQSINTNILTYANMTGLLNLGQQVSTLLQLPLNVDASMLTPTQTADITAPGAIRQESFFPEFKPNTTATPRWNGNLKKLLLKPDSNGVYQYYDANGALAISTTDGRIKTTALTYWTNSGLLGTGISVDGRTTTLGGAGQHVPGFALTGGGNPGRSNTDTTTGATDRTLYYDHITSTAFALGNIDASSSTSAAVTELVPDLLGAGTSPTATYETAANCGTAKTAAQVAQETLLFARGFDTGTSCQGSKGSTSVVGRSWLEGAVMHSRPVAIDYGARSGYSVTSPDIRIVYGSADGYMRMVRNSDGLESWGFLPRTTMSQQVLLRNNANNVIFPYGADGAPAVLIQDRMPNQATGTGDGIIDSGNPYDHAWMYFGLRRSGIFQNYANRGYYYAMDVTNPDSPTLMWRIGPDGLYNSGGLLANTASNYAELGLTFSTPQIGRLTIGGTTKPVLFFGGGYNGGRDSAGNKLGKDYYRGSAGRVGTDDTSVVAAGPDGIQGTSDDITTTTNVGNAVYIVDAQTGALIWKATYSASATGTAGALQSGGTAYVYQHPLLTNSIASDVTIADTDGDGLTDRLYVADTGGRLWRGDFTGTDLTKWTLAPLVSVGRYRNNDVADDRRFFGAPDYAPVRASANIAADTNYGNYDEVIFGSGDREDPLNTTTVNYFYGYRDYRTASGPPTTVITSDSALQGTGSSTGNDFVDLTSACSSGAAGCASSYNLSTGWKIQLTGSGEKAFNQPLSSGGDVFFSTYTPPNPTSLACTPSEGTSTIYGIALLDSRALTGVLSSSTTPSRSIASTAPGLPGEVNTLGNGALAVNTQNFNLPSLLPYSIYWRERRGDEATEITQPTQ